MRVMEVRTKVKGVRRPAEKLGWRSGLGRVMKERWDQLLAVVFDSWVTRD